VRLQIVALVRCGYCLSNRPPNRTQATQSATRKGRTVAASGILHQDQIKTRAAYILDSQHHSLARTRAGAILAVLIGKLYDAGSGNIFRSAIRIAHAQLATHETVHCSRPWACHLVGLLRDARFLSVTYLRTPDGKFEQGIYRAGPLLKKLVVALLKLHFPRAKDKQPNSRVNSTQQSSPPRTSRESFSHGWSIVKAAINKARGLPAP
jgi:hypothetical protein